MPRTLSIFYYHSMVVSARRSRKSASAMSSEHDGCMPYIDELYYLFTTQHGKVHGTTGLDILWQRSWGQRNATMGYSTYYLHCAEHSKRVCPSCGVDG